MLKAQEGNRNCHVGQTDKSSRLLVTCVDPQIAYLMQVISLIREKLFRHNVLGEQPQHMKDQINTIRQFFTVNTRATE